MKLTVLAKQNVAAETACVALGHGDGAPLPAFRPGAHIEITVGGLMRRYSLTSRPEVSAAYEITVLGVSPSRGGSAYIHDRLQVGDVLDVSAPVNAFPLNEAAAHSIFIAGGIGVTPFLSMMEALARLQRSFECHYAVARADRMIPVADHEGRVARYVATNGAPGLSIDKLIRRSSRRLSNAGAAGAEHVHLCLLVH
jgi:vanillate monooxygenase ferredoxin subunit